MSCGRAGVLVGQLRFTHKPRFFAIRDGGCQGQSPEPAADLVQVVLWLLSSLRSCPDPCPVTPRGPPRALTSGWDGAVPEWRGDTGIRPD